MKAYTVKSVGDQNEESLKTVFQNLPSKGTPYKYTYCNVNSSFEILNVSTGSHNMDVLAQQNNDMGIEQKGNAISGEKLLNTD